MFRNITLLLAICAHLLATTDSGRAAVFERDWKEPGDGLLTYDDVNQREWLDVPESLLLDNGTYENVIAQTGPGEKFAGFRAAKSDDVISLAQSAGIDTNTLAVEANALAAHKLIELLGPTVTLTGGRVSTTGLLNEYIESSQRTDASRLVGNLRVTPQLDVAGLTIFPFAEIRVDNPFAITGIMLFRAIPEPSSIMIAIIASTVTLLQRCRS